MAASFTSSAENFKYITPSDNRHRDISPLPTTSTPSALPPVAESIPSCIAPDYKLSGVRQPRRDFIFTPKDDHVRFVLAYPPAPFSKFRPHFQQYLHRDNTVVVIMTFLCLSAMGESRLRWHAALCTQQGRCLTYFANAGIFAAAASDHEKEHGAAKHHLPWRWGTQW
eukprot:SAG11_NODE_43_length_20795_cov_11.860456_14_plen_168_part_00